MRRLIFILIAAAIGSVLCATARKSTWDDDARKRKASYYYIQAVDAYLGEKYGLYGQLLDKAYRLDPDDPELTARLGEWLILTSANDSAALENGFRMMFDGYADKPDDYFEGMQLLNLTSNYRRWDDNLKAAELLATRFPSRNEVTMQLGRSYLVRAMMGDTSYIGKALGIFSELEDRVGKSAHLTDLKIRTYAINNDTAAIVRELANLTAASPADPYTALAVGQVFNSLAMPDSALHYFDRACELDSTNGGAILMRARFFQEQGDSATFEREALRAVKSPDLDFESKAKFVVNYINIHAGDTVEGGRIDNMFEALLDAHSGEPDVYRLYAEYLAQTGKPVQAADRMSYVVSLQPSERDNWLFLAQLYVDAKEYAKAADALGEGSKMFPGDLTFIRPEAVYRSFSGDTDRAIKLLESYPDSTITNPEELSEFKSLLGDFYYKEKRRDDAFAAYEDALKANPFNYMAMNNVAYYYAETDTLLDKAESYSKRTVRHEPDNTTYLDTYAWVLFKKGDYAGAREQIDRTISLVEFDNSIDSIDATIDMIEDDTVPQSGESVAEAVEVVEPSLSGSAELYDHAGDIYFRCGDVTKAVDYWKKALKREPEAPDMIKSKIKHRKIIEKNDP